MEQTNFKSRDKFATSLKQYDTSIPLRTQFIAFFDNIPQSVNQSNLRGLELMQGDSNGWNVDIARQILVDKPENSKNIGCIFINGSVLPSESLNINSAQIENNRGFLQGTILEGREAFSSNQITIQFRETNTSFTDLILRPWLIVAAHKGFVARPAAESIKTNITIFQFSGASFAEKKPIQFDASTKNFSSDTQLKIRKIWKYYDCVPTSVDVRTLTYADEGVDTFNVTFAYDNYNIINGGIKTSINIPDFKLPGDPGYERQNRGIVSGLLQLLGAPNKVQGGREIEKNITNNLSRDISNFTADYVNRLENQQITFNPNINVVPRLQTQPPTGVTAPVSSYNGVINSLSNPLIGYKGSITNKFAPSSTTTTTASYISNKIPPPPIIKNAVTTPPALVGKQDINVVIKPLPLFVVPVIPSPGGP